MRTGTLLLVMMLAGCFASRAQGRAGREDTVLKGATIEVLQAYKPEIRQAPKPEWIPQLPPPDTVHNPVSYKDIPQQSLFYSYNALPLHPLDLNSKADSLPFANYVALGAGNLSTLFVDAGIGSLRGDHYETDIHLHHLSQKGDIQNQQTSLTGLEANGAYHTSSLDWRFGLRAEQDNYHLYGYDHALYHLSADTTLQPFTTIAASASVQNKDSNAALGYHPFVTWSTISTHYDARESDFSFNLPAWYRFDNNLQARVALLGTVTHFSASPWGSSVDNHYSFTVLQPGFGYEGEGFQGHAYLGLGTSTQRQYLLPDIAASFRPEGSNTIWQAGIQYQLVSQNLLMLSAENPYMLPWNILKPSSMGQYYAGVKAGIGDHFSFAGKVSYWYYESLATFANVYLQYLEPRWMAMESDNDVNALSVEASGRYSVGDKWSVGLCESFYNFSGGNLPKVGGIPTTRIRADVQVRASSRLSLGAYASFTSGVWVYPVSSLVSQLPSFTDLGCSATYRVVSRINVFARASNLLNDHYQRWLYYPSYGLNVYGGLELKF